MFKKSPKTKQFELFSSPSGLMCEREGRLYDDEGAWHNKFFREEQCPTIDSYYGLRRKMCEYEETQGKNLFDECFKKLTKAQIKEYRNRHTAEYTMWHRRSTS